jgi:transcriptional pleiotropic regulator of transition state genes
VKGGKSLKATGMVRKVDGLGRIVIPREICNLQGIELSKTRMEIFVAGEAVLLRKFEPGCTFCGSMDELKSFGGKQVCVHCRDEFKRGLKEAGA